MFKMNRVLTTVLVLFVSAVPALATPPATGIDAEFLEMARTIPGFGGYFFDAEGRPNVYLKSLDQAPFFKSINPELQVREGRYDFAELFEYRMAARESVMGLEGVVKLDIDEVSNRVRIGVENRRAAAAVRATLREIGVPRRAVIIEQTDPIFYLATLRDEFRPVPGGVQIHFGQFVCTLSYNRTRSGVAGFVTNSHCTDRQGGVEDTEYFQPLSPAAVAVEIADPDYFRNSNGCPKGKKCRFSDSSFAQYDAGVSGASAIAKPTTSAQFGAGLEVNGTFSISGFSTGSVAVGTTVNKVGRTTGWSFGPVTDSCVDVAVSGSNIMQLCQDIVTGGVGGGDSGSPVFTGNSSVTVVGTLWGGNGAGTLFVYSPYSAIKSELGLD